MIAKTGRPVCGSNRRPAPFRKGISRQMRLFFLIFLALSALPMPVWANPSPAAKSSITSEWSGAARMQVVWVQDMGDNRDVFAQGGSLRLMGLDTSDGQGERAILGALGNYSKPLITPRGDRVVYSDRAQKKVFVVNWDGSGQRAVLGGFALALWRNPADGREWLYYGTMEGKDGSEHCPAVYRVLLDSPGTPELIWNKTPVSVHSFQVSADGRMAGGLFPWPSGGIAQLPNRAMKIHAKGCWSAMSPERGKSHLWIFDGAHRNLTIVNPETERKWQVNINGAPGIDGYEVYHPRWSNQSRIMAMTGPYKTGFGGNKISGGGRNIEIFIGRFNPGLTKIESWRQITRNDRADFFPDVWVAPVEGAKPAEVKGSGAEATGKKRAAAGPAPGGETRKARAAPSKTPATGKTPKRLVVEARLTEPSVIPSPQDIAPYRRALLVNGYEVVRVISGSYGRRKLMAAHWVIEDAIVLQDAIRQKGKTYRMVLERYDDHPELEGERLIMDSDEFRLPLYYELRN